MTDDSECPYFESWQISHKGECDTQALDQSHALKVHTLNNDTECLCFESW